MELVFVGVYSFSVGSRDSATPYETDRNLEDFQVTLRGRGFEMAFKFNGGMRLLVAAEDLFANLILEGEKADQCEGLH